MQSRFMALFLQLPSSAVRCLERAYQLPRAGSLFFRLDDAGVDHANATLTLLYAGEYPAVEILIGRSITVGPPCLSLRHSISTIERTEDELTILAAIARNPRLPTTPSFFRYQHLREGMTIAQALRRGVTRRDIREWRNAGEIKLERRVS